MDIRIKLFAVLRVNLCDAVPLEHFLELHVRHAEPVVQRVEVRVVLAQDLLRYALRRLRQDVRHLETRRLRGDKIGLFKISNGYVNIDYTIFSKLRKVRYLEGTTSRW